MINIYTTDQLGITFDGENRWISIPETNDDIDWITKNPKILDQIYKLLDNNDPKNIN